MIKFDNSRFFQNQSIFVDTKSWNVADTQHVTWTGRFYYRCNSETFTSTTVTYTFGGHDYDTTRLWPWLRNNRKKVMVFGSPLKRADKMTTFSYQNAYFPKGKPVVEFLVQLRYKLVTNWYKFWLEVNPSVFPKFPRLHVGLS